jgi:tyrosine aminotransferase
MRVRIIVFRCSPCVFGNLSAPSVLTETVVENVRSLKHNGYLHSAGSVEARAAVASWVATPESPLTADDVVIASGCSGALDLAIGVLLNPGDTLLVPMPAFPLYQTLAHARGVLIKHYRLLPDKRWEADIGHLDSLIDERCGIEHAFCSQLFFPSKLSCLVVVVPL